MGMMNDGFSLADAMALTDRNNDCGGDNWIWIFFLFFLLAFGGGGLFGGGNSANSAAVQGALTRSDLFEGFQANDVSRHMDDIQSGMYQGFYNVNAGFQNIGDLLTESRFDNAKCCCETNRNIDAIRYENAKNTCDIINAGHADAQRIVDLFTANEMQRLRDELQSAQLQLHNVGQTQTLIDVLRPYPSPAYITCSPYESVPLPGKVFAK